MSGYAQSHKQPVAAPSPSTLLSYLNTDPSSDTIFYAVWVGALTYAAARSGLEFSKATSVGVAAATGLGVYMQWWQLATQHIANLSAPYTTTTRTATSPPEPKQYQGRTHIEDV